MMSVSRIFMGAALLMPAALACSSDDEDGGSTLGGGATGGTLSSGTGATPSSGAGGSGVASGGSSASGTGGSLTPGAGGGLGNSGGSGTGTTADGGAFESCSGVTAEAESLPVQLELVVDTSLSMGEQAPGTDRSKWEVTREAVLEAISEMPATTALGATFYPRVSIQSSTCYEADVGVPIAELGSAGSGQRSALEEIFAEAGPNGGTPTHMAYQFGLNHLRQSSLPSRRYLLLITDGAPTWGLQCSGVGSIAVDNEPMILEAQKAARGTADVPSVRTFVVGSPGSETAVQDLSRMAEAGRTARADCSSDGPRYCHFDMTQEPDFAAALKQALKDIVGATLSCEYPVPEPPEGNALDRNLVNVQFIAGDGATHEIFQSADPDSCSSGWMYSDDGTSVILCGESCDLVKADPAGKIEVLFGCQTVVEVR